MRHMTKDRLAKLLRTPSVLDEDSIPGLEEIVARYPYYTNGHILLTIQYKLLDHIRYENQLRRASVHVPNRSILRKLVLSPSEIPMPGDPVQLEQLAESTVREEPVVETSIAPMEVVKDEPAQVHVEEDTSLAPAPAPPSRKDPREVIEERLRELKAQELAMREQLEMAVDKDLFPVVDRKQEPDQVEKTHIPDSVVVSPATAELKTDENDLGTAKREPEPEPEAPVVSKTSAVPVEHHTEKPEPAPLGETTEVPKPLPKSGKHPFTDWLKSSPAPVSNKSPESTPAGFTGYRLDDPKEHVKSDNAPASGSPKETDLIEKFIREEPRIVPAKSEFYSPGNMARKSAQDHEDLISETLARIYAQQGRYDKAIVTYERLSLKLPEKKAYFASLIEKLKNRD